MAIRTESINTEDELAEAFSIRRQVFIIDQNVPEEIEMDEFDKKEFGEHGVYRLLSSKGTTIVKLDLVKGKIAFLDSEAYAEGTLKFERPFIYEILFIDGTENFKTFNIV